MWSNEKIWGDLNLSELNDIHKMVHVLYNMRVHDFFLSKFRCSDVIFY